MNGLNDMCSWLVRKANNLQCFWSLRRFLILTTLFLVLCAVKARKKSGFGPGLTAQSGGKKDGHSNSFTKKKKPYPKSNALAGLTTI